MPIIAIGGGELGTRQTFPIDERIVRLTGRRRPKALLIPAASNDSPSYCEAFSRIYGDDLGCETSVLYLAGRDKHPNPPGAEILASDLIYVGGGDTQRLMRYLSDPDIKQALMLAAERGSVLCGISAGSICWFDQGISPSSGYRKGLVEGLGLVKATNIVHYDPLHWQHDRGKLRRVELLLEEYRGVILALQDLAAIEIDGDCYRIIAADPKAHAHRILIRNGRMTTDTLTSGKLDSLLEPSAREWNRG
jgi:dipeptidase E